MNGFKAARLRANLTQEAAAAALNVTQPALCNWESGKYSPRLKMLPEIARVYGCTVSDLLNEQDQSEGRMA